MLERADARNWVPTDRAGEWVTGSQPLAGLEVFSARGSTRHWSEPLHETFTIAVVQPSVIATGAEWRTRGQSLVTTGGQLMNINAGDSHCTSRVPAPSAFDVIKFSTSWIDEAEKNLARPGARQPFRFRSPTCENAKVFEAVQRLVCGLAAGESSLAIESTCHELAFAVVTELAEAPPQRNSLDAVKDFRLRRVREYLIEHPDSRPSLDALEQDTGLGKSQLCALFRKEYGISIGQYWTGCRIAKARSLLLRGVPAKHVAVDLGFTDEAYFSRIFKRHQGLAPGAWVRLYRSGVRRG